MNRRSVRWAALVIVVLAGAGCGSGQKVETASGGEVPAKLTDPNCNAAGAPDAATVELDEGGPFALPAKPTWLDERPYCALVSAAAQSPSGNRLAVATPDGDGWVNLAQGSIYSASLVPVFQGDDNALVGYFNPRTGFVAASERGAIEGGEVFARAGASEYIAALRQACATETDPKAPVICDDVTRALLASGARPNLEDFVDPVS